MDIFSDDFDHEAPHGTSIDEVLTREAEDEAKSQGVRVLVIGDTKHIFSRHFMTRAKARGCTVRVGYGFELETSNPYNASLNTAAPLNAQADATTAADTDSTGLLTGGGSNSTITNAHDVPTAVATAVETTAGGSAPMPLERRSTTVDEEVMLLDSDDTCNLSAAVEGVDHVVFVASGVAGYGSRTSLTEERLRDLVHAMHKMSSAKDHKLLIVPFGESTNYSPVVNAGPPPPGNPPPHAPKSSCSCLSFFTSLSSSSSRNRSHSSVSGDDTPPIVTQQETLVSVDQIHQAICEESRTHRQQQQKQQLQQHQVRWVIPRLPPRYRYDDGATKGDLTYKPVEANENAGGSHLVLQPKGRSTSSAKAKFVSVADLALWAIRVLHEDEVGDVCLEVKYESSVSSSSSRSVDDDDEEEEEEALVVNNSRSDLL